MFGKNKTAEKFTVEEYQEMKRKREKRRFHFQLYPLPITLTFLIPVAFFLVIIITYILYVKTLPNQ